MSCLLLEVNLLDLCSVSLHLVDWYWCCINTVYLCWSCSHLRDSLIWVWTAVDTCSVLTPTVSIVYFTIPNQVCDKTCHYCQCFSLMVKGGEFEMTNSPVFPRNQAQLNFPTKILQIAAELFSFSRLINRVTATKTFLATFLDGFRKWSIKKIVLPQPATNVKPFKV